MKFVYILRKNDDPNTYIGFTNNSIQMHLSHQCCCYNANRKEYHHKVWKHIRENGGLKSWTYLILENFSDEVDDTLLREKAQHYMDIHRPTLNTYNFIFGDQVEYKAKYYKENKERIAENNAKWYKENKEQIAENRKQNKEQRAEYDAKYYKENKEKRAEYKAKYYKENKEQIAENNAKYYKENKERIAENNAKYRKENKEQIAAVKRQKRQYQKSWGGDLRCDNCNLLRIDVSIFS